MDIVQIRTVGATGLHAIGNLSKQVAEKNKYKLYLDPLTQLSYPENDAKSVKLELILRKEQECLSKCGLEKLCPKTL